MQKIVLLVIGLMIGATFKAVAQPAQIISAIRSGNAQSVAVFFDATTMVAVPGQTVQADPAKAKQALNSFFAANAVSGFTVSHNMDRNKVSITIGELNTSKGKYRATLQVRNKGGKEVIEELRIEK